jgi:hypothetical protein
MAVFQTAADPIGSHGLDLAATSTYPHDAQLDSFRIADSPKVK